MSDTSTRTDSKTLGLTRWVQVAFLVVFVALFWVLDRLVVLGWGLFAEPSPTVASAVAALVSGVTVWRLYREAQIVGWAHEVAGELAKVAWPSRRETSASTIVVIVTSILAAVIVGAFDAAWSAITDLIYGA